MTDPRAKYQEALAAFAAPGGRWANKGALTYWGKAAGLTAEEIISDARAAGVADRDADIRRGWDDARPKGEVRRGSYVPRAANPKPPPQHAAYVRHLIGDLHYAAANATTDWVRELSPCLDWLGKPPQVQTEMFMRALFRPDEFVHVLDISNPPAGRIGVNVRTMNDWLSVLNRNGELPGDGLLPNPLSGSEGKTKGGKTSFIADSCLADFPFALIEFDDVRCAFGGDTKNGLAAQLGFWRRFLLSSPLAPALVSLTYSGSKSFHGLLYVGAKTREEWESFQVRLAALFSSDEESLTVTKGDRQTQNYPFRCDVQSLRPRQATRLAGAKRRDKDTMQELVYLNPEARKNG